MLNCTLFYQLNKSFYLKFGYDYMCLDEIMSNYITKNCKLSLDDIGLHKLIM
ncbi:MAG: hypothetical protein K0S61_2468 [Anaerocolumna sp.]|jgi:hypothetical protein|nr:hypothetical protein [Anaerocolumna sp.]